MSPLLDNLTGFDDEDYVRAQHRRQPMRDHDRGAPLHQMTERVED
jgi:hypothetical protein